MISEENNWEQLPVISVHKACRKGGPSAEKSREKKLEHYFLTGKVF